MKELPATLVMRPFNFDTLATQAYRLASDERLAEASTASLAIVVVGLLPMVLLCRQIAAERPEAARRPPRGAAGQRQPARSKTFCAVGGVRRPFLDRQGVGLEPPSASSAGLPTFAVVTTGHSLLPSAK